MIKINMYNVHVHVHVHPMYMYVKVRGLQEEASQEFEHANAQSHRNKQT